MKKLEGVYVVDTLDRIGEYIQLGERFEAAIAFLKGNDLGSLTPGRHDIAEGIYANVDEATLRLPSEARPELHHRYFDIQVPLTHEETIGVARFEGEVAKAVDFEKDFGFVDGLSVEPIEVKPGEFAILYPDVCAHAPCCTNDAAGTKVRKVIVKVAR